MVLCATELGREEKEMQGDGDSAGTWAGRALPGRGELSWALISANSLLGKRSPAQCHRKTTKQTLQLLREEDLWGWFGLRHR